jgi:hypothetical protein
MNIQPEQAYSVCQSVPAAPSGDGPAGTFKKPRAHKATATDTKKADLSRRKSITMQRAKLAKRKRPSGDQRT